MEPDSPELTAWLDEVGGVARRPADQGETVTANRRWWDAEAPTYQREHGAFLGESDFVWGPEGWQEHELAVLGPPGSLRGARILEFGCGTAPCGRWLALQGAQVVSSDLSAGMLREGEAIHERIRQEKGEAHPLPTLVQSDATCSPFADNSFDLVVSSYGAVPFVADSAGLIRELARVLRPGGRLAYSTTHPVRWAFPDVPGPDGLVAHGSYFDRTPYVETDIDGTATYVEHHRTVGDRVRDVIAAGLRLVDLIEPTWPERNPQTWGGWSPLRGEHLPGTLIVVADKPAS